MQLFEPIFKALNRAGIRYVTVGGVAVVLHGHVRLTADLDFAIDLSPPHARKAITTLGQLGLSPRVPVDPMAFADPSVRKGWIDQKGMRVFQMLDTANPLRSVDLFVENPIDFEDLWGRSEVKMIGDTPARIASIPDIILLKKSADRPEDRADVEVLEKMLEIRDSRNG